MNGGFKWSLFGSPDRNKKKTTTPEEEAKIASAQEKVAGRKAKERVHQLRQEFAEARVASIESDKAIAEKDAAVEEQGIQKISNEQNSADARAAQIYEDAARNAGLTLDESIKALPPEERTKKIRALMEEQRTSKEQVAEDLRVKAQGLAALAQEARKVADLIAVKAPTDDFTTEDTALFGNRVEDGGQK